MLLLRRGDVRCRRNWAAGRLRLLHDRPRRPAAPGGSAGDRRAGGVRAPAGRSVEGGLHGHGRAFPQPGNVLARSGPAGHRRRHRPTRSWCSPPSATPRAFERLPLGRVNRRWPVAAHHGRRELREKLLPRARIRTGRPAGPPWPTAAPPVTRCSCGGRCGRAGVNDGDEFDAPGRAAAGREGHRRPDPAQ